MIKNNLFSIQIESYHSFFLIIEEAADLVALATAPSAASFATPKSLSRRGFPPKKKAKTIIMSTRVKGKASIGDENQRRISSMATTPRAT